MTKRRRIRRTPGVMGVRLGKHDQHYPQVFAARMRISASSPRAIEARAQWERENRT